MIFLTSTCTSYLNKHLFLACFVYLILSQKYWMTINIINLIFFNKLQRYVVFKKSISINSFTVNVTGYGCFHGGVRYIIVWKPLAYSKAGVQNNLSSVTKSCTVLKQFAVVAVLSNFPTDRSMEKFITLWSITCHLQFGSVHQ